jgi:hypothetical protein
VAGAGEETEEGVRRFLKVKCMSRGYTFNFKSRGEIGKRLCPAGLPLSSCPHPLG